MIKLSRRGLILNTFVFDLDGTLINGKMEISEKTVEQIYRIYEKKENIILCSGRMYKSVIFVRDKFLPFLKDYAPVVSYNGSVIADKNGEIVFSSVIDKNTSLELLEYFTERNIHKQIYLNDFLYSDNENDNIKLYAKHAGVDFEIIPSLSDFMEKSNNLPIKIIAIGESELLCDVQKELIPKYSELNIVKSFTTYLDINNKNSSKGLAVKKLSEMMNFDYKKAYIFGDSENDVSMLEISDNSFAMGNADEYVKSKAAYTTKTNYEDGVAFAIEKIYSDTDLSDII